LTKTFLFHFFLKKISFVKIYKKTELTNLFKLFNMKKINLLIFSFAITLHIFANPVSIDVARTVAKNFFYEKTNTKQNKINFTENTIFYNNETSYFIFNIENNNGFIIVSAEDNYNPIIAYSLNNSFETENQPDNLKYWLQTISDKIEYIKNNNITATNKIKNLWSAYNTPYNSFQKNNSKITIIEPLTEHIKWNQGSGWNALCPEDQSGPSGHVYAGCVATAMGIVMKYWNYPIQGSGSHGYTPDGYDYQFADYGNTTYFWSYMEDGSPNYYSALLQYHLGISVEMMYGANGSGAWSEDVPYALENYFNYSSNIEHVDRYGYSDNEWIAILKEQLDDAKPMYYSGCSNSGCHAFVCDGYDSDNYFHFNFGWGGSSNGFFLLDNVGGYSSWNAVVRNIEPPVEYLQPVANLEADLDFETENKVNIDWQSSNNKEITSYTLYRNEEIVAEDIPTTTSTFTDTNVPDGEYFYGIRAIYSDGDAICASDFVEVKTNFEVIFQIRKNDNTMFYSPLLTVDFNGQTAIENFIGEVTFQNVPLGENQNYTVSCPDYEEINGLVNINSDNKFTIIMESSVNVENNQQSNISIFPNPSKNGIFQVEGIRKNSQISIYDITGKSVYNKTLSTQKINLSNLNKGIYLIKIQENNVIFTEKLIIQ